MDCSKMSGGLLQSKPCVEFLMFTQLYSPNICMQISHSPSTFEVMLSSKQSMYNLTTTTTKEKSKWKKHVGNQGL